MSKTMIVTIICLTGLTGSTAQVKTSYALDLGLTFSHFQQQVKAEVGDPRGERLVNELQFGIMAIATYQFWEHASGGVFVQFDRGNRHAARFNGFDAGSGKTVTTDKIGGNYSEVWVGPMVRIHWKQLLGEFGYGLGGFRKDDARTDLVSATGDSTGRFTMNPAIAWYAALGGAFPVAEDIEIVIRLEYRLRYYNKRGGDPFRENIEHGTQNITPYVGVRWNL